LEGAGEELVMICRRRGGGEGGEGEERERERVSVKMRDGRERVEDGDTN
jgi:hypothetical protein